jgi:hypothetical protein
MINMHHVANRIAEKAYARGLAEGRAQELEWAADEIGHTETKDIDGLADKLRDRAAEIRKEQSK